MATAVLVVLIVAIAGTNSIETNNYCLPWMYRPKNDSDRCVCGVSLGGKIQCEIMNGSHEIHLQNCLCMTYDNSTAVAEVGYCPYACITSWRRGNIVRQDRETLNTQMCGIWKRRGTLCSQCQSQYGVPLYSYDIGCVKCEGNKRKEIFKFIAAAYLPLTVMLVFVTIFPFDILSPPWSMFVIVAQILSAPPVLQGMFSHMQLLHINPIPVKLFAVAYAGILGFWNLDFFRGVYSASCISPHIKNLHQAAIDGSIGLYPLFFLAILSILVRMYKKGCRVIVVVWKPIHFCLSRFRRRLDLRTSLINTFATFMLLSYTKIGYAAMNILTPTRVWTPNGSYQWAVFHDPSVKYFGLSHIPCAFVFL